MKNILKTLILGLIFNSAFAEIPSKEELKKMSVFISNFTEARIWEVDIEDFNEYSEKELNEKAKQRLYLQKKLFVEFGIEHNHLNNYESKIKNSPCSKKKDYYEIEVKYVQESIDKYFGYKLQNNLPEHFENDIIILENNCYYRHFDDVAYLTYAKVNSVKKQKDGIVFMLGILYSNLDNEFEGLFIAKAKEKTYKGKKTWELISLKIIN